MSKRRLYVRCMAWLLCITGCAYLPAYSADELPPAEVGGMLIDRTFSAAGSAFYKEFSVRWNELAVLTGNVNVSIFEQPQMRGGTRAIIEMDGKAVVIVPLQPGRPAPAQAAVEAAITRISVLLGQGYIDEVAKPLPLDDQGDARGW
ncbi:curli production assembly/transport protein CsgE [Burkholderiaceae bacterium DAT-1]|nr:curli production assembly/transport protein CsgE [Burkholderiaceae bacterium DAT-1]